MNNPYIIAEVGINASGSLNDALKLIDMAKETGCDAVKFQKRTIDIVYSQEEQRKPRESKWGSTNGDQKRGLEFGKSEYDVIDRRCNLIGIDWFASAWDIPSLKFLEKYDLKHNKIASAMTTNLSFCESVANQGKHTFIATGMTTLAEIDTVVGIFEKERCDFTLMHAVSIYPCEDSDCNLLTIPFLRDRYRCPVGYSGHEKGILPSILAVSLGSVAIERHITLDRTGYGSDQSASLERHGLELLVRDCRSVSSMLGDGEKRILSKEAECASKLRYW
jgi:N-acetylneuraminate synthase